jgi:hypothetical protein
MGGMDTSDSVSPAQTGQPRSVKASSELIEVTGRTARFVKISVVIILGLLIWWPLVFLAVAFIVPTLAVAAILVALGAAIAAPIWLLVRRVRARHRAHQSMLSPHRLQP